MERRAGEGEEEEEEEKTRLGTKGVSVTKQ